MITIATTPSGSSTHGVPEDRVVVHVRGELDLDSVAAIEPTLSALARHGRSALRLDLGGLDFCDSSGINLFLRMRTRCARSGTRLTLTGIAGQPAQVIRLVRLAEAIDCHFTTAAPPNAPRRRTGTRA
ncbi:STAS domain-containing protein [Embleya sp. NBC_00896]|uniref:STAS domain-containing protein n=1 Tax=Embleya sp. NBC_00896 TaxID=2975961 RepID=UPI00386A1863|nr:STAS domain-containing protein [Embleya sp. NBC_00896]